MGTALIAEMPRDPKWRGTRITGTCPRGR